MESWVASRGTVLRGVGATVLWHYRVEGCPPWFCLVGYKKAERPLDKLMRLVGNCNCCRNKIVEEKEEKGVFVGLMQEVVMSWGHKNTRRCFGCEIPDLEWQSRNK